MTSPQDKLETALGYRFSDRKFRDTALTHRSYSHSHYERLEFLGDSVLGLTISTLLYRRFPELPEGDLSRLRAHLVKEDSLHQIALSLHLGDYLYLGEGELKSGGKNRASILADSLEALFAAIYLESGFQVVSEVIEKLFAPSIAAIAPGQSLKDPKTRLQEWLQGQRLPLPTYSLLATSGAAHAQLFHVACAIEAPYSLKSEGQGKSRRLAEQAAAEAALDLLETESRARP
ncbi:MAG: ribonuclease III [Zoogloeaceae bacterium]|jgi:ribonuclease-3|nr:ribonuclease III [Zoogloeaceae bacterium]